jgi:copper chaperone CopZ
MVAALMLTSAVVAAEEVTADIRVPKMDCGACAVVVKKLLRETKGVKNTEIDVDKRMVTVTYEDSQVTESQLRQVIQKTGFEVEPGNEKR